MPSENLENKPSVEPTPRPKQEESVQRGAFPAVPERNYVQLTPIATPQPKFASKQILKVQPGPKVHTTPKPALVSHSVSHSVTTEVHSASKGHSALKVEIAPRVQPTPATKAPRVYSAAPKVQSGQRVPPPKPTQRVLAAKVNPVPRAHPTQAPAAKVYSAAPKVQSARKAPSPPKFKSPPRAYPSLKLASKKVYSAGPKVYSKPKGAPTPRPGAQRSSPNVKKPSLKPVFPSTKKVPNRPRYIHKPVQPSPRRPVSRPPSLPQNALFPPPKLTASLPRKPLFLGGHPKRKPPQRAQSRSDGGVHHPLTVGPVFHRPSSSSFTYKTPALPVRAPLLFSQVDSDERPYVAIGQNALDDEESFGDLLLHLTRFHENDDYRPTNKTSARKVESRPSAPERPAPPPQEIAFTHQVISPPRQASRPPPLFPKLKRQDVLNALDAVDQSVKPLIQAAGILSSSFSLDSTRKQSVEDVVQEKTLDTVTDTLQFTVNQVLANPDPLIIISALLLSVITGSAIGNTINTVNGANIRSGPGLGGGLTKRIGDCPPGYEVVFIDEDGLMSSLGSILEVRVKREDSGDEEEERLEKQDRKGYPFRKKLTKSSGHQATTTPKQVWPTQQVDTDVIFGKPGYYCKKVETGGDHVQAGDGGEMVAKAKLILYSSAL